MHVLWFLQLVPETAIRPSFRAAHQTDRFLWQCQAMPIPTHSSMTTLRRCFHSPSRSPARSASCHKGQNPTQTTSSFSQSLQTRLPSPERLRPASASQVQLLDSSQSTFCIARGDKAGCSPKPSFLHQPERPPHSRESGTISIKSFQKSPLCFHPWAGLQLGARSRVSLAIPAVPEGLNTLQEPWQGSAHQHEKS